MARKTPKVSSEELSVDDLRGILIDNGARDEDVARFDEVVSRRRFFGLLGKGSAATALLGLGAGADVALNGLFGSGVLPYAWAQEAEGSTEIPGKPGMIVHNTKPVNGEFAPEMLNDDVTPQARHFVRNNGLVSARAESMDLQDWKLTIDGEVHKTLELSMDELKKFPEVTVHASIECGGNGRALFDPPVRGNPWKYGAIGCSEWTGVRLRDVLKAAGLKDSAIYTGHYGEDPPLAGDPFSRGVPIEKAMDEHTIIAYRMNGEDLPALNGFPVRLVVPGWIGSCSQKWLNRIWVRDQVHDSKKMKGFAYRNPIHPVAPGERGSEDDTEILTAWRIKSMITSMGDNAKVAAGEKVNVRGHAWAGENKVDRVMISTDYGATWQKTKLKRGKTKYAWCSFETDVVFKMAGYYEIWSQAIDNDDNAQPFRQPWNPKGYLGNMVHRVPVMVG